MQLQGLFAVASTRDIRNAETFYTGLFGRGPDDRPMEGLIQWRFGQAGIQVVSDAKNSGSSRMTIVTPSMVETRAMLRDAGLTLGGDIQGDFGIIAQIDDSDGNRVTLAEPPRGLNA